LPFEFDLWLSHGCICVRHTWREVLVPRKYVCVLQKPGAPPQKVVLIRAAIGAACARAAFVRVTPTLMSDLTMCHGVIQEALELLPCDDQQLQRVRSHTQS
jgi:hypothetical protein